MLKTKLRYLDRNSSKLIGSITKPYPGENELSRCILKLLNTQVINSPMSSCGSMRKVAFLGIITEQNKGNKNEDFL